MCFNMPPAYAKVPMFVREINGAGEAYGTKQSYVNIQDVANIEQVSANHWEGKSKSGLKNLDGSDRVYHFDNQGAQQIVNYMA